eukprot:9978893-Alexandrium_andersonii.AAC.1
MRDAIASQSVAPKAAAQPQAPAGGRPVMDVTVDVVTAAGQIPEASRRVERGPQPTYMSDRAIFDVDFGDLDVFERQVIDWVRFWRPDEPAIQAMQRAPPTVLCVLLSRPSG